MTWSVRKHDEVVGIGKTAAADARQSLIQSGTIVQIGERLEIRNRKELVGDFLAGYVHVLRPELGLGAFRPLGGNPTVVLRRLNDWARRTKVSWTATGSQAALALTMLGGGERITIFLAKLPEYPEREVQLVADKTGPVTILRSFGTLFPWRMQAGVPIAHPALIVGELAQERKPEALEIAAL